MRTLPRIACLSALLGLLAPSAAAQIIVVDGDDLAAIVDAAPSGSVVEIHSDATFAGPITIGADKDLVMRAAPGNAPAIQGGPSSAVIVILGDASVRLQGLRLASNGSPQRAVSLSGSSLSTGELLSVDVEECELVGSLYGLIAGSGSLDLDLTDTAVQADGLDLLQISSGLIDVSAEGCVLDRVEVLASTSGQALLHLEDCVLAGASSFGYSEGPLDVELIRCRIEDELALEESVPAPPVAVPDARLFAESSLFVGDGAPGTSGLRLDDPGALGGLRLELLGCTVTGFERGIELPVTPQASGALDFRNNLLANNTFDLTGNATGGVFERNLAEDVDLGPGNLFQVAQLDPDLALLPGAPGTDDGLSAGLPLGPRDVLGNARIVDVDCDGTAEVSIGAIEAPPSLFARTELFAGGNPAGTQTGLPVVGANMQVQVDLGAGGVLGFIAIGAPIAAPLSIPGWKGTILIDLASFLVFETPGGTVQLPLPLDLALVGTSTSIQGARVEALPGSFLIQLLDRVDLTFGY